MPFYKDPMSYGNLIVEFKVEFPKKNYFNKEKLDKVIQILGGKDKKAATSEKKDAKTKILEEYS